MKTMNKILTMDEIKNEVTALAEKYRIDSVYLFGSYARDEATIDSDLDVLVIGGDQFQLTNVFAFAEDLGEALQKDVDVYEIHEVNEGSEFQEEIMKERLLIA